MQSLVIVRLSGSIITELQTIQRDAQGAEEKTACVISAAAYSEL